VSTDLHEDLHQLATQDLLASACQGDDDAWKEIYRRYQALLTVMVRVRIPSLVRRRFDTEDVLQSAFVSIYEQIRRFQYQGEGSFRKWLVSVVVNKLRDSLKHHQRAKRSVDSEKPADDTASLAGPTTDPDSDPSKLAERAEEQARILEGMSRLNENDQELLCMRIFEHLTWEQIAAIEECSESRVRRHYEDAVIRLTRMLS